MTPQCPRPTTPARDRRLAPLVALLPAAALATGLGAGALGCTGDGGGLVAFQYTLTLTGFDDDVGQLFELRAVNSTTGAEVDRVRVAAIPTSTFTVVVIGLHAGERYDLDFYADHDGDGRYDAPPTDHAWRVPVGPLAGHGVGTSDHAVVQVDIQFP